jgi:hypothetical protein
MTLGFNFGWSLCHLCTRTWPKRGWFQPVDATLSNQLMGKYLLEKSARLTYVAKPSLGKVPAELTLSSALTFVFSERGCVLSVALTS